MTLKNLLYEIAKYASKNKIINYSAAGPSLYQLNMETIKDYPVLFASPTGSHNVSPNLTTYTITLYYIDRLTTGGENDVDILSNSVEGLKTIINGIKRIPGIVEIYDDYSITNFADTQRMSDKVAGAYATIVIRTTNETTCTGEASVDGDYIPDIDNIKLQNKGLSIDENGTYTITADAGYTGLKTVNLNVNVPTGLTIIDVADYDIKLGNSPFTEVPEIFDFSNVTDMSRMFEGCMNLITIPQLYTSNVNNMAYMFNGCMSLQTIPELDTSNVTNMAKMFEGCISLQTIPELDTSIVIDMGYMFTSCSSLQTIPQLDTSKVNLMSYMFFGCSSLQTIPELDTSRVTSMSQMFNGAINLISLPALNATNINNLMSYFGNQNLENLTDVGGWIGLKINWSDNYGLAKCPNLTYQSCINILNGLADVTELSGKTLKVHPNFLTTVGDEISIGINKNWTITA